MRRLLIPCLMILLVSFGCDSLEVNTEKRVDDDPIGDITYFTGQFTTVNIDTSGHAGSQIDLIGLTETGQRVSQTPLEMNGHGYMSITDDEQHLYLLSRRFGTLYKVSPSGDEIQGQWADLSDVWHPTAVTYIDTRDELLLLYRHTRKSTRYRARFVNKNNISEHSRDLVVSYDFLSSGQTGIYSMAYRDNRFYALGINNNGTPALIQMNMDFEVTDQSDNISSEAAGIDFKDDQLYISHFDGSIMRFGDNN